MAKFRCETRQPAQSHELPPPPQHWVGERWGGVFQYTQVQPNTCWSVLGTERFHWDPKRPWADRQQGRRAPHLSYRTACGSLLSVLPSPARTPGGTYWVLIRPRLRAFRGRINTLSARTAKASYFHCGFISPKTQRKAACIPPETGALAPVPGGAPPAPAEPPKLGRWGHSGEARPRESMAFGMEFSAQKRSCVSGSAETKLHLSQLLPPRQLMGGAGLAGSRGPLSENKMPLCGQQSRVCGRRRYSTSAGRRAAAGRLLGTYGQLPAPFWQLWELAKGRGEGEQTQNKAKMVIPNTPQPEGEARTPTRVRVKPEGTGPGLQRDTPFGEENGHKKQGLETQ